MRHRTNLIYKTSKKPYQVRPRSATVIISWHDNRPRRNYRHFTASPAVLILVGNFASAQLRDDFAKVKKRLAAGSRTESSEKLAIRREGKCLSRANLQLLELVCITARLEERLQVE